MAQIVSVSCPHCGASVAVSCTYTGGGSSDSAICRGCGRSVKVAYHNDSFGFRIDRVYN